MVQPNEPDFFELLRSIVGWLFGALMGLVLFTWKKQTKDTETRLALIEANAAKKHEFEQLREDMQAEHAENVRRLEKIAEKIDTGITGTHQRIDSLFDRLADRDRNAR